MNRLNALCIVAAIAISGSISFGQSATTMPTSAPVKVDQSAIAAQVLPSLAKVEITVKVDKGQEPRADGWAVRCPSCGNYHGGGDVSQLIEQERPFELGGYILSPTKVLLNDPIMHGRFISRIAVRYGQQVVDAKIAAYCRDQNGIILELAQPLKDAKPLAFAPTKGAIFGVTYARSNGQWITNVTPVTRNSAVTEDGRQFASMPSNCLIVDDKGQAVAVSMREDMPTDNSWMISPEKWDVVSADEMAKQLTSLESVCNQSLMRVGLSFRSPKKNAGERTPSMSIGEDEGTNEQNVMGVLLDEQTVAVMHCIKRDATSRLEKIRVFPAGENAQPINAKFVSSLKDLGCFIVKLDKPIKAPLAISAKPLTSLQCKLMFGADIELQGEKKISYYLHNRVAAFDLGWKGQVYPEVRGKTSNLYLFDDEGKLLAMPIVRRPKAGNESRYSGSSPALTPAAYLKAACDDLANNSDPSNCPVTEDDESKIAWTGLVCQSLNKELARVNNVSEQTNDGKTGALVSYVYPDSPADKAGIKVGYVLLRLQVSDQPKPIEVVLGGDYMGDRQFPWDRLDQLPEAYYDQIPPPWPSVDDTISKTLTDVGFGKKCTAEFFYNGEIVKRDFVIEQGPPHFASAPKFKSAELGLTVRDMTYELRRYFQREKADPGVIIAKEEPGSKASIAGIKPYEVITHVDGEPVMNVQDFEKLTKKSGEIKLSIKRMSKGRVVKIKVNGTTMPATATAPATPDKVAKTPSVEIMD